MGKVRGRQQERDAEIEGDVQSLSACLSVHATLPACPPGMEQ